MLIYKNINMNPKHRKTGDCSTRALTACLGIAYESVIDLQAKWAKKSYYDFTSRQVTERILSEFGYIKQKMVKDSNGKRVRIRNLDEFIPLTIRNLGVIINVNNHYVYVKGNEYWDSWDSGYKITGNWYSKI